MASSRDTAADFIQDTFRPLVGVLCSEEAERHCQKNNLSFVKLIEPFCTIAEGSLKDINNTGHTVKNFKIVCHDLNELAVSKLISKKKLNDIISRSYTLDTQLQSQQKHPSHLGIPLDHGSSMMQNDHSPSKKLEQNLKSPWYESYRKSFLESLPYSDHEYLRHYVACVIAVSTSEPQPLDQLNSLFHSPTPSHHPSMAQSNTSVQTLLHEAKWFVPTFLRFIVLLHDVSEQDDMKADAVYQAVKEKFGNQSCHLLHINSRPLLPFHGNKVDDDERSLLSNPWIKFASEHNQNADVRDACYSQDTDSLVSQNSLATSHDHPLADHPLMSPRLPQVDVEDDTKVSKAPGSCLTPSDIDRIIIFVTQFITHALFPWAERTLKNLNEQTSTRKGIKGSIFSASKWFGRSKPVGQGQSSSSVVYSSDSPEMQLRRLADISFLFQMYELSYQTYHAIKKDFHSDSAWMHHAGALEMACLSVYLQGSASSRQYPCHYMEQAIKSYFVGAHSVNFAARATILSTEILRSKNMFAEAATQFMSVTSEDSDLLSALFLEQTAQCFLEMRGPMVRKYAFHMVMAGHRFNKAGQKKHVLRCYAQALEIFKDKGWSLAEDHIYLTIGSQAYNIRELGLATSAYLHLLNPHSKQSANQQAAFFAQYLNIHKQQVSLSSPVDTPRKQLEILPLPLVDSKTIKVTCSLTSQPSPDGKMLASGISLDEDDNDREVSFKELEEQLAAVAIRESSVTNFFKPSIFRHDQQSDNSSNVLAVVGEPIHIELCLENPLKIPLTLLNVHPLWRFSPILGSSSPQSDADSVSNELLFQEKVASAQPPCVQSQPISEFHLEGSQTKKLRVSLTCSKHGTLHMTGLAFHLMTKLRPGNGSGGAADAGSTTGSSSVSGSSSFMSISGSNIADHDSSVGVLSNGFMSQTRSVSNISAIPSIVPTTFFVPGMIGLEARGNRLNKTKEERMNVKYAVDRRLHFDVLPVKSKLELYLYDLPTSMLCGEVVQSRLEFVNLGRRSVTKLFLASNLMEIFSFRDEDVAKVPNKKGVIKIALPKGGLSPGKSISNVLKIKCPEQSGKHPVDILVLYAGDDEEDEECKKMCSRMRYRLIRHNTCIKAEASLIITSQSFPSLLSVSPPADDVVRDGEEDESSKAHSTQSSIDISLKVDNINPGYDFSVSKIVCISKQWSLKPSQSQDTGGDVSVKPGEYHLLSLGAHKRNLPDESKDLVSSLSFSNCEEPIEVFHSTGSMDSLQNLPAPPTSTLHRARGYTDQVADHRIDVFNKTVETKFMLVIIWKSDSLADESKRYGHHVLLFNKLEEVVESAPVPKSPLSVPQIKFTNTQTSDVTLDLPLNRDVMSKLVKMSLQYEHTISHDFSTHRSCIVSVKVFLLNSSDFELSVSVEAEDVTSRSREPATGDLQHHKSNRMRSFMWVGRTKVSMRLGSNQDASHLIKARVYQAGIYDLSCIKTYVSICGDDLSTSDDEDRIFDVPLTESTKETNMLSILHRVPQKALNPLLFTVLDAAKE